MADFAGSNEPIKEVEGEDEFKPAITLLMNKSGACKVHGPVHDLILCYGLLELAKDLIKENHKNQAKPKIMPANGGIMNFLRNGKR